MKVKVVKNLYLLCKQNGHLMTIQGNEFLHTPTAKERNSEIEEIMKLEDAAEVFYLKHMYTVKEIDENVIGGLI